MYACLRKIFRISMGRRVRDYPSYNYAHLSQWEANEVPALTEFALQLSKLH